MPNTGSNTTNRKRTAPGNPPQTANKKFKGTTATIVGNTVAQKGVQAVSQAATNAASNNSQTRRYASRALSFKQVNGEWVIKGRPTWNSNIIEHMNVKPGQHRRHIIPSHLLLESFRQYINANPKTIETQVDAFITKYKITTRGTQLADKFQAVAKFNHNNSNNLFPERGDENTAIGFLPTEITKILKESGAYFKTQSNQKGLTKAQKQQIAQDTVSWVEQELNKLKTKGFQFILGVKTEILDIALAHIKYITQTTNNYYDRVKSFLRDEIIPSLELDLNKMEELKNQNYKAIEIYKKLDKLRFGEIGKINFFDVMDEFHNLPQN